VELVVDSGHPAASVAAAVRSAVARTGLVVPVSEVVTMREVIRRSQWVTRFFGEQLAIYALFALLIAAVGIYGLVADSVVQRRGEIAVRLALGARPRDVRRSVVGGAARLGAVGLTAGLLSGVGIAHASRAMLGDVPAADPAVLAAVVLLLTATLLAATWGPAREAANADPARALRSE
jgi:ABC-type antimicrobial peptide transport system permease subunit